jgi:multidrug resistance efflux pump
MYLRTLRPPALPPPPVARRRHFPIARIVLIGALLGVLAYIFVPRYLNVTAYGLVQGDLVPVAPLFSARLASRLVECEQSVKQGQPLAIVTNFIMEGQYAQEYQRAEEDERTQQIAETEGLSQALTDEAAARAKYDSALYQARKLELTKTAYERTYRQGAIGRVAYENAAAEWQAADAEAAGYRQMMVAAQEHVQRVRDESSERVAGFQQQAQLVNSLKNQVHAQTLSAPISGRVVECTAQPAQVVDAGAPIYKIFSPKRAYVLAYFEPNSVQHVRLGARATVTLTGFDAPFHGRVTAIYSSLSKLPDQLTKYFWQKEQWSEYRPVKIVLDDVTPRLLGELTYDSQVNVSIPQRAGVLESLQRGVGMR